MRGIYRRSVTRSDDGEKTKKLANLEYGKLYLSQLQSSGAEL